MTCARPVGSSFLWQRAGRSEGKGDVLIKEADTSQMWPEIQTSHARTTVQWPRHRLVHVNVFVLSTMIYRSTVLRQDEEAFYAPQRVQFWHEVSINLAHKVFSDVLVDYWVLFQLQYCSVSCWLATESKTFKIPQHHSSRTGIKPGISRYVSVDDHLRL